MQWLLCVFALPVHRCLRQAECILPVCAESQVANRQAQTETWGADGTTRHAAKARDVHCECTAPKFRASRDQRRAGSWHKNTGARRHATLTACWQARQRVDSGQNCASCTVLNIQVSDTHHAHWSLPMQKTRDAAGNHCSPALVCPLAM